MPDSLGAAITTLAALPIAALTGQWLGTPSQPTHPELLWIFVFVLWLAAFIAFLRRHFVELGQKTKISTKDSTKVADKVGRQS